MSGNQPTPHARWVHEATHCNGIPVSADLPLTADELATIRARADVIETGNLRAVSTRVLAEDVLRLVAEIERLQARVTASDLIRGMHDQTYFGEADVARLVLSRLQRDAELP